MGAAKDSACPCLFLLVSFPLALFYLLILTDLSTFEPFFCLLCFIVFAWLMFTSAAFQLVDFAVWFPIMLGESAELR